MVAPIISFPGSTVSRADLVASAQKLKDSPPLPFPQVVGHSADCFLRSLPQFQGDTVGEIRVAVNQRIADSQVLLACGKQQQMRSLWMGLGAVALEGASLACLNAHPAVAVATGAAGLGLFLTSVFLSTRGDSKVASANAAISEAAGVGRHLENFGAYLAPVQPQPAPVSATARK